MLIVAVYCADATLSIGIKFRFFPFNFRYNCCFGLFGGLASH